MENIEDGYYEVDIKGNLTFFNESMRKILGHEREKLVGMNNRQYTDEENSRKVYQTFNRVYQTGKPVKNFEWQIIRKDGTRRDVEVSISLIRNAEGHPTGFRGIVQDSTDRKQAEEDRKTLQERLQRAEKMEALGTLAGGVAHDLNNVLGGLVGYSELLLIDIPEGNAWRGHVSSILNSSLRAAAIIQDLLTLSRRGVATSEVVNLNKLIPDFIKTPEFEKMKAYHPHVSLKTDLEEGLLNIKGSQVHLGKTIMNLISNASEAISGQGEVIIRTTNCHIDKPIRGYDEMQEGDYVVLSVSDNGEGISASDIKKIFEPFYTKKVMGRSGTGLGLAVVWGTVKDHDGYIDVQSEDGKGSTFTIYLPATREEATGDEQKISPEQYMGRGETILVVDDVKEQREVAASMLTRLGYRVEAVSGGEEAIVYLKAGKVDLIVLDMIMDPGMDGLETYQRALAINPKQRAIIVSGFSETDRVHKALALGAGAYVRKPYMMEKIGMAVRRELLKVTNRDSS
jgi:PAS domain S-box-containing protein